MSHEPKEALPKAYNPSTIEERWAEYWVRERIFDVAPPDGASANKTFTMLLPPPNVTGRLHIGHMLNQTEMDILTRWHRMRGETALWVPGTDHAGIATQMMVERQLAGEGKRRQEMGREAFEARVWQWRSLYGGAILDQMKRLGSTVDWSREYFTMDERLNVAVREAFVRLYEQGLIYRGAYFVNWDPQIQTAVSDLEVESEERLGKLYHIRYQLEDGSGSVVIATTRPETMLGDSAVAVNPSDIRYQHLVGKMLVLPLNYRSVDSYGDTPLGRDDFIDGDFVMRRIPIVADSWANPEFGTGAVKVTPAHDRNDDEIRKRHDLPIIDVMDNAARINANGGIYSGLDRFNARAQIVADLEASGALVEIKDHMLTLPISQRTGVIIEPRRSVQWFVAVNKTPDSGGESIAAKAIRAVSEGHIRFTPPQYRKTYDEWMGNIHDWCVSRQLWWGHRIPAWTCTDCGQTTVARETPAACKWCGGLAPVQETDVLDTWFSSGLLPFTVFGWPNAVADTGMPSLTPDLAAFYPTQLLVTGFDILFFWVARMIMLGCHFMLDVPMPDGQQRTLKDAVPFSEVYIHALVRDADRQKMSKTKGNVVDPIEVITKFGTDAVRFTLASMASPGTDIAFSEARTEGNRAFANKIWNAARFLFMNIERATQGSGTILGYRGQDLNPKPIVLPVGTQLESRWIVSCLSKTADEVNRSLDAYRFDEAASAVYQFFWGDLCDWYLELIKLRLNFEEGSDRTAAMESLGILIGVFDAALRMLSPFMPFITEEIWHALWSAGAPAKSIALTRFPQAADYAADAIAVEEMETMQELIVSVRALRKEMGVPEKETTAISVFAGAEIGALVQANADMLAKLARVSGVGLASEALTGDGTRSTASFDVAVIYERQIDVVAERERLTKDLAKYEKGVAAADRQLNNEAFMAKAPGHIVEGLRKQHAETKMLYEKTKSALDALPSE